MIEKFFDALNVTNPNNGQRNIKFFQSPYTSAKDFRLKVCVLCYCPWCSYSCICISAKFCTDVKLSQLLLYSS